MNDFIKSFVAYGRTRSDCPTEFWYHGAMAALAAAMGNKIHTSGWSRPIYPNLWVALIAPSGYGKSAPLDLAEAVLRKANLAHHFLPNSLSREAFILALSNEPNEMMIRHELSNVIAETNKSYNEGMMQDLTEWYDVPVSVTRKLVKDEYTINRPCITVLGASTPTWLGAALSDKALEGGFLSRFMFCPSFKAGAFVADPGPPNEAIEEGLGSHLRWVSSFRGEYDMTPVRDAFTAWERPLRLSRDSWTPEHAGIYNRMPALAKKVTMIVGMARHPRQMEATNDDLDTAIRYVEHNTERAVSYLGDSVVATEYADAKRLKAIVDRAGSAIEHRALLAAFKGGLRGFRAAVDLAEQAGWLVVNRDDDVKLTQYLTKED